MRSLRLATGTILLAALSATGGCGSGSSTSGEDSGAIRETDASVDSVVSVARDGSSLTTTDVANVATPSNVVDDGYLTTGPWAGYGFTATDPGAAQIVPDCSSNACDPPFVGKVLLHARDRHRATRLHRLCHAGLERESGHGR
jgi:hypothetical protein